MSARASTGRRNGLPGEAAAAASDPAACTVSGYQEVCIDADIAITAAATPRTPVVTCLLPPTVNPFGTNTCSTTGIPCGFTAQVTLCVAVPVVLGATASPAALRQQCQAPTTVACFRSCPFFEPKSQGFLSGNFNLQDIPADAVCRAVECVKGTSSFLSDLLPSPCPTPGSPCPGDLNDLAACATVVTNLMTQAGAVAALTPLCPPPPPTFGALPATLRQLLAVLLDACLCTTTGGGIDVGGVLLTDRVNLSAFPAEDLTALGLTASCVTVADVAAEANAILATCNRELAGLIAPILAAMAQDSGVTIIQPIPCP